MQIMGRMFYEASNFDDDISNFRFDALQNRSLFIQKTSFSRENYDKLLKAWE